MIVPPQRSVSKIMKLIALFLGLILANATLAAELKLAGLFTDHMVCLLYTSDAADDREV